MTAKQKNIIKAEYTIHGKPLNTVSSAKYLGLTIDTNSVGYGPYSTKAYGRSLLVGSSQCNAVRYMYAYQPANNCGDCGLLSATTGLLVVTVAMALAFSYQVWHDNLS